MPDPTRGGPPWRGTAPEDHTASAITDDRTGTRLIAASDVVALLRRVAGADTETLGALRGEAFAAEVVAQLPDAPASPDRAVLARQADVLDELAGRVTELAAAVNSPSAPAWAGDISTRLSALDRQVDALVERDSDAGCQFVATECFGGDCSAGGCGLDADMRDAIELATGVAP